MPLSRSSMQQTVRILEEVRIPGEDKALRVPTLADEFRRIELRL